MGVEFLLDEIIQRERERERQSAGADGKKGKGSSDSSTERNRDPGLVIQLLTDDNKEVSDCWQKEKKFCHLLVCVRQTPKVIVTRSPFDDGGRVVHTQRLKRINDKDDRYN